MKSSELHKYCEEATPWALAAFVALLLLVSTAVYLACWVLAP
jgi:hypothetical protein